MKHIFITLVLLLFATSFVPAVAQSIVVIGKVTDAKGSPLPGASIKLKGTKIGTSSKNNGDYSIAIPERKGAVLVFSFIGMKSQSIPVTGERLNVKMSEASSELHEVVIESTGYQNIDKRISTSSIVTLSGDQVLETGGVSLDNMLLGKVPGMVVLGTNSTPGAATKIRIRGASTISGTREPLWVVDGIILDDPVPLSAEEINSLDNVNLIGNAISSLNPSDIESVDILKDAAATAIYGVRAANGVIVVTTKKGKKGNIRINYSGDFTLTERPDYKRMHLMNSQQRVELSKEIEEKALPFFFPPARVGYEGALMDLYDRVITEEEFLKRVQRIEQVNTDWFDILFRTAFKQKHNVSFSGGTDFVNYYFSGAYTNAQNTTKGKGLVQYNANMKLFFNVTSKLTGNIQLRASIQDKDYTHTSVSPYSYAYNTSRAIPAFDEQGNYEFYNRDKGFASTTGNINPLLFNILNEIDHTGNKIHSNSLNFVTTWQYKPIKDLTLSTTFGLNIANTSDKNWFDEQSFQAASLRRLNYGQKLPSTEVFREEQCQLPYGGGVTMNNTRNLSYQLRGQIVYTLIPSKGHMLTINAGPEIRSTTYNGFRTTRYGYLPNRGETFVNIDTSVWPMHRKLLNAHPDMITNRLSNFVSLFSTLTYSYRSRYITTFNLRADGSNKFGQDTKARFLPIWSVSGRWNAHNEKFLTEVPFLNTLAFKASYGLQGNVSDDATPNLIMRLGSLDQFSQEYINKLVKLPNHDLRWEKNHSFNMGGELSLFDNRISISVDYYYKRGVDQIVARKVVPTLGVNTVMINAGTLTNKGVDISVNLMPITTKNFTWAINFNGARNENIVTNSSNSQRYGYEEFLRGTAILNGKPIDSFYSYRFAGLDKKGLPTFHGTEPQDGDTREIVYDRVLISSGSRIPIIQGGFGSNFRYKNVSLNLFFSYSLGNHIRRNFLYDNGGQRLPQPQQNLSDEFVDRWRKPGDENRTNIPGLSSEVFKLKKLSIFGDNDNNQIEYANNIWQMYNNSDIRVVSGNHLRLRSASITYRFPKELLTPLKMSDASVRIEGYNLFLLSSKELRGQDPDQLRLGARSEPPLPSYGLTVNLSF